MLGLRCLPCAGSAPMLVFRGVYAATPTAKRSEGKADVALQRSRAGFRPALLAQSNVEIER